MGSKTNGHSMATLIAGPTASGKTALALKLAAASDAAIVNADSMQIYAILNSLTARPTADELDSASHHLFGHVHPSELYSTGRWLRDVETLLTGPLAERPVIIVGGTGLYFRALEGGLSEMPSVPDEIRQYWRGRMAEEGAEALYNELVRRDPDAARAIGRSDGQRILRGIEIFETTGKPLSQHQKKKGKSLVDPSTTRRIVIRAERDWLRERIAHRFAAMMQKGAVDEVRELLALGLDPALPAMKAIGVRQIGMMLDGQMTEEDAIRHSVDATRQYAKRQTTWFRNQLGSDWTAHDPNDTQS